MKRTWPLRLIQASPLIVLALMAGLYLALPASLRTLQFETVFASRDPQIAEAGYRRPDLYHEAVTRLEGEIDHARGNATGNTPTAEGKLEGVALAITSRVMNDAPRLYDEGGRIRPLAIPDTDPVFDALHRYETDTGARVGVFVMNPEVRPPVALRSVASTSVLTADELRELRHPGRWKP